VGSSFLNVDSTPTRNDLDSSGLDSGSGDIGQSYPLFTSGIADSLVSGVGLIVVVPVVVGALAVLLSVLMFRSGRFDGETIMPYIIIVVLSGIVAVVAVVIISMVGNIFVPVG
jgi:hypothetical protein